MSEIIYFIKRLLRFFFILPISVVFATTFPDHPIKWIVPYPPGGTTDVIARSLAQNLSNKLGQPIVIENKPGAGGQVAMNYVVKAPADGYTFLVSDASLATIQSLYKNLPFNPQIDLMPVTLFVTVPHIVVINPSINVDHLKELIRLNQSQPDKLIFSSGGLGSPLHLAGESLRLSTGMQWLHVPYKGAGPALLATLSNEAQIVTPSLPAVLPQIKAQKLKALAIMSEKRSPLLPEIPTVGELGYPKANAVGWVGLSAPAGTSQEIINKFTELNKFSLQDKDLQDRLQAQGAISAIDVSPNGYAKFINIQKQHWKEIVQSAGITPE
jgi:tripartite-type tricarboxylate transporter receptor subunit TctC